MVRLKGFLSGVPLSRSMEDIKKEIQGGKAIDARSLKSRRDGSLEETLSVVVQPEKTLTKWAP